MRTAKRLWVRVCSLAVEQELSVLTVPVDLWPPVHQAGLRMPPLLGPAFLKEVAFRSAGLSLRLTTV